MSTTQESAYQVASGAGRGLQKRTFNGTERSFAVKHGIGGYWEERERCGHVRERGRGP